jgi:hypothetical protein
MGAEQGTATGRGTNVKAAARSVEAAAIAGLAFAVLFFIAKGSFDRAPAPNDTDIAVGSWYANTGNQRSMIAALNLLVVGSMR